MINNENTSSEEMNYAQEGDSIFKFWKSDGTVIPSALYNFFDAQGFGLYYPENADEKSSSPVVVKVTGNRISEVTETFLLRIAKNHVLEVLEDGQSDSVIDSLHRSTGLFGKKNQNLLTKLDLKLITDTKDSAYLFFKNGVLEITTADIQLKQYEDFDGYVWQKNIIEHAFIPVTAESLTVNCQFLDFLHEVTKVGDVAESSNRFNSLISIIGYLSHRYKDPVKTKAIILMDAAPSGSPNGRTGKTLICLAVGKIRNLSILDGKSFDQRHWFKYSSVGLYTDILLFDDLQKNFEFEQLFPLVTTGLLVQKKYKDNFFIPYESSPKIVITTNYAIAGESSSFKGRTFEFEISNTFNSDYQPTDKYRKRFFDDWNESEWNEFYNLIANAIRFYLQNGLVQSEPINMKLSKLIFQTNEDFVDFAKTKIEMGVRYDKRELYNRFIALFPEHRLLTQRTFTEWLRKWGRYLGADLAETHSNDIRTITFVVNSAP